MIVGKRLRRSLTAMPEFLCPIIGTCLSLKELQKITRRWDYGGDKTPYELHSWLVRNCQTSPAVAKYVQKYLMRKYRGIVQRLDEYEGEALWQAWEEEVRNGRVAAAFWAIVTRLDAPQSIVERVFGEVHMMSHLQAAEVRSELKEAAAWRREQQELARRLEKNRRQLAAQRQVTAELRHQLQELAAAYRRLQQQWRESQQQVDRLTAGTVLTELQQENQSLRQEIQRLQLELIQEQRARRQAEKGLNLLQKPAQNEAVSAGQTCSGMPENCPRLQLPTCPLHSSESCPGLCNKHILLVGGLDNLVPHYRDLVEEDFGAIFLHHDGDFRQGQTRLALLVKRADAVICPVGVNSHEACLCVKKLCKRQQKPCVLLPKAGMGALKQALLQLAARTTN